MTHPSSPPPGWYHAQGDPPGTNRWWDGATRVGGPVLGPGAPPAYGGPGVPMPGSAGPYGYSSGHGYGMPGPFRSTGEPPGVGRAIGRGFARYLSAIPCGLGYLWMLWDPQKQTWHDKITDTVVIRAPGY